MVEVSVDSRALLASPVALEMRATSLEGAVAVRAARIARKDLPIVYDQECNNNLEGSSGGIEVPT